LRVRKCSTRKDDRHVSLEERTAIANGSNADLFISIHPNSSHSREARGAEGLIGTCNVNRQSGEIHSRIYNNWKR
jgi:N-acetylmuramoyl-L-alanine amidase